MIVDRSVELLVEELDRVRERFECERAVVRGLGLGRVGRSVDEQRPVTLGTDATVADLNDVSRRELVATDVTLPGHAEHPRNGVTDDWSVSEHPGVVTS